MDARDLLEVEIVAIGLPAFVAALIAKSNYGAREGGLFEDSGTLERVIGPAPAVVGQMVEGVVGKPIE